MFTLNIQIPELLSFNRHRDAHAATDTERCDAAFQISIFHEM